MFQSLQDVIGTIPTYIIVVHQVKFSHKYNTLDGLKYFYISKLALSEMGLLQICSFSGLSTLKVIMFHSFLFLFFLVVVNLQITRKINAIGLLPKDVLKTETFPFSAELSMVFYLILGWFIPCSW